MRTLCGTIIVVAVALVATAEDGTTKVLKNREGTDPGGGL